MKRPQVPKVSWVLVRLNICEHLAAFGMGELRTARSAFKAFNCVSPFHRMWKMQKI